MTFQNLRPRQSVTFLIPNGIGRHGVEYKEKTGRVVITFSDRVVVNGGGRHGVPYVVGAGNFLRAGK